MKFSSRQKDIFLSLARDAIRGFLGSGKYLQLQEDELDDEMQVLLEDRACFVTLYKKGKLRGCIGTTQANGKLYKNIIRYAVYAATEDDRFDSVGVAEI